MSAWMLTDEVAAEIRETPQTVADKCSRGEIRATRLGRGWRIKRDDLDAYMDSLIPTNVQRRSTLDRGTS